MTGVSGEYPAFVPRLTPAVSQKLGDEYQKLLRRLRLPMPIASSTSIRLIFSFSVSFS
jgi:hypothetical protein|tara:strand:- start:317 stop:490 length:174 start_codon:yes stop_codon:yes gene_type:complete